MTWTDISKKKLYEDQKAHENGGDTFVSISSKLTLNMRISDLCMSLYINFILIKIVQEGQEEKGLGLNLARPLDLGGLGQVT